MNAVRVCPYTHLFLSENIQVTKVLQANFPTSNHMNWVHNKNVKRFAFDMHSSTLVYYSHDTFVRYFGNFLTFHPNSDIKHQRSCLSQDNSCMLLLSIGKIQRLFPGAPVLQERVVNRPIPYD